MMGGSAGRTKKPVGRAALRWAMSKWLNSIWRLTSSRWVLMSIGEPEVGRTWRWGLWQGVSIFEPFLGNDSVS
jgi:hypothetical protein